MSHVRPLAAVALTLGIFVAALALQGPKPAAPPAPPAPRADADASPKFWKGNLHTHTLWSDGDDFPDMVADWYKRNGYHFLALTDHNVIAEGERWIDVAGGKADRTAALKKYVGRFGERWVERRERDGKRQVRLKPLAEFRGLLDEAGKFTLIPAEEITHAYAKRPVHMNGINLRDVVKPIDGKDAGETISVNVRQVEEQRAKTGRRMVTFLNHPNFGWGVTAEDILAAGNVAAFEVFNGHPGVRNYGDKDHASTERVWDILLALRLGKMGQPPVWGLATDDAHAYHQFDGTKSNPGRGWVMVRAAHLTPESVVRAIEAGDFYSTSGVVLDDVLADREGVRLVIRGEPGVSYSTAFIATMKGANLNPEPVAGPDGKPLPVTRAYPADVGRVVATADGLRPSYRLTGNELYVRAKVTSTKAHPNPYAKGDVEVAWTQPLVP